MYEKIEDNKKSSLIQLNCYCFVFIKRFFGPKIKLFFVIIKYSKHFICTFYQNAKLNIIVPFHY